MNAMECVPKVLLKGWQDVKSLVYRISEPLPQVVVHLSFVIVTHFVGSKHPDRVAEKLRIFASLPLAGLS